MARATTNDTLSGRGPAAGFGLPDRVVELLREVGWILQVALASSTCS